MRSNFFMCSAIAFIKSGGTQFPICRMPSSNSPAKANPSGKEENRLNSGSEKRRRSAQYMAPCIPRFPSLRRTVRAGFFGSNLTALKPWPVMRLSDDPIRTLSQYLNERYFLAASNKAASCSGGVKQPARESPHAIGSVSGPGCTSTNPLSPR